MRRWALKGQIWLLTLASGGGLLVLEGCDDTVRETVLGGVESASTTLLTTFLNAFFESVVSDTDNTVTTVRAITEHAQSFFA